MEANEKQSTEAQAITVQIPDSSSMSEKVSPLVRYAKELVVNSQLTYDNATTKLREIKAVSDKVDEVFDPVVEAGHKAHKAGLAAKAMFSKPLGEARDLIQQKAGQWFQSEQQRIADERRQLEAKAEADAEAERTAKLQQAEKALNRGEIEKASALLDSAEAVKPEQVITVAPRSKSYGVSTRENWSAEVINESLVPREYMTPDLKKLNALARAMKDGNAAPPGVKFVKATGFNVR